MYIKHLYLSWEIPENGSVILKNHWELTYGDIISTQPDATRAEQKKQPSKNISGWLRRNYLLANHSTGWKMLSRKHGN
jgi:hypothetical protein